MRDRTTTSSPFALLDPKPTANTTCQASSPIFSERSSYSSSPDSARSIISTHSIKKRWIRKEKIGQGAQGSVYRCEDAATGEEVAAKIILIKELSPKEVEGIKREVRTMKKLQHPHLVRYLQATEKKQKKLSIYMEYVRGGSLSSKLRQSGPLPMPKVKKFTRQLSKVLQYLHTHRIAHRDIKCANIFVTSDGNAIKLGDFGAFKEIGSVSLIGGLKGTPHWMAPEVIREQEMHEDGWFKADIWSLGCAVLEMLTGHSPWQQYSNPMTAMYQIVSSNNTPTIPADASEEASSFLKWCLQRNPDDRPTTTELLLHPFLRKETTGTRNEKKATPAVNKCHPEVTSMATSTTSSKARKDAKAIALSKGITNKNNTEKQPVKNQVCSPESLCRDENQVPRTSPTRTGQDITTSSYSESGRRPRNILKSSAGTASLIPLKPSQIPRLKPLGIPESHTNQEPDRSPPMSIEKSPTQSKTRTGIPSVSRGASTSALSQLPRLEKHSLSGISPVQLRRISTAPTPSTRDETEDVSTRLKYRNRFCLPPLSTRSTSE